MSSIFSEHTSLVDEIFLTGKDKSVVLWSIQDHVSALAAEPGSAKSTASGGANSKNASKSGGNGEKPLESPSIGARGKYLGHEDTVEDVQFCPSRYFALFSQCIGHM